MSPLALMPAAAGAGGASLTRPVAPVPVYPSAAATRPACASKYDELNEMWFTLEIGKHPAFAQFLPESLRTLENYRRSKTSAALVPNPATLNQEYIKERFEHSKLRAVHCYNMYQSSYTGTDFVLLGNLDLMENADVISNFGYCSVIPIREFLKHKPPTLTGSVLCDDSWTLIVNDCFVLGGMRAEKSFIVVKNGQKLTFDSLWNTAAGMPRVFARELMILIHHGYIPHYTETNGLSLDLPTCYPTLAQRANFETVSEAVKKLTCIEDVLQYLPPEALAPELIAAYPVATSHP